MGTKCLANGQKLMAEARRPPEQIVSLGHRPCQILLKNPYLMGYPADRYSRYPGEDVFDDDGAGHEAHLVFKRRRGPVRGV